MNRFRKNALDGLLCLILAFWLAASAQAADITLSEWQREVAEVRIHAENDARNAYREAQLLQAGMPGDASAIDKARILNLIARIELYLSLIGKSAQHSAEAKEIARQSHDRAGQIEANLVIASSAINQGRLEDMIEATRENMDLLVGLNHEDMRAEVMFHAAMMYLRLGQSDEAATLAMQSLEIAKNSSNQKALAFAENGVAVAYVQSGRYAEAREHYQRMLEAARQAHSTLLEGGARLGLSGIAANQGARADAEQECAEAIRLFRRAGGPLFVGHALFQMAELHLGNKQPGKALTLLNEDVDIYQRHDNPIGLWWTLNSRSAVLQALGQMNAARSDAQRASELANRIGFSVYLAGSARRLAEIVAAQGDFRQAYRLSAQAEEISKKLEREKSSKRIFDLAQRFQQESKQRKIDELTRQTEQDAARQRWLWTVLGGMSALLALTAFFIIRLRRSRAEIGKLNLTLEQRVQERTAELFQSRNSLEEAQRIAHLGSWENNLVDNVLTWSDEVFRIFEIDPQQFGASYEAFMDTVHPDDRQLLDQAYKTSLEKHEPFAIEHRLLMPDGRIKYVYEHCETIYAPDGKPLRSIGTVQDITERKYMEEALVARERELRALAESSPGMMGSFYLRPDGTVCMPYVSSNIHELFGLQPQEVAADASALMKLNHPDDAQRVLDTIAESARNMTTWHCEYRIQHPTKGERWMESNTNPQPHPDGGTIWYGYVHDITGRKRMEAALSESEARYRDHFNQLQSMLESSASVSVFALDRECRYLFFNNRHREGAKRIRGTDIAIGMNMIESISDQAFREFCRQGFDRVLAGNSVSVESKEKVVTDGKLAYEYNDNFGSPIFNDAGEVVGLTVFAINTTARKRLEAELLASHNFLDSVIDSVSDPIFVKDRQHRWTLLNDAFCNFAGISREALLGKSDYDIFPKEQADVFWAKDEIVFESGEVNLNEEHFTSADGTEHHIQTKKASFIAADGQQMLVGVIRDITEFKRYEIAREAALAEAQRLTKLRGEFLAQVSHELRTPLNGILGYAQLLGRDKRLDERQLAGVNIIRQSGEHLLTLVNDILDFTKIEVSKMSIVRNNIELESFLHAVAGIMRIKTDEKRLEFVCIIAPDLPAWVGVDEKRLRQVLLNLISNAVKFTRCGTVSLRVSRTESGRLRFEVQDTGIGIAAEQLDAIFQPFEQVGEHRYHHGGTGLGLPISRQFVRLMGSDIQVSSTLGQGSTFWFELEVQADTATPLEQRNATGYTGGSQTLALVDDAEANLAKPFVIPPQAEMKILHHLAQRGSIRDILLRASHIIEMDERYLPFAEQLRSMAQGYQTKAILRFVEQYLEKKP